MAVAAFLLVFRLVSPFLFFLFVEKMVSALRYSKLYQSSSSLPYPFELSSFLDAVCLFFAIEEEEEEIEEDDDDDDEEEYEEEEEGGLVW